MAWQIAHAPRTAVTAIRRSLGMGRIITRDDTEIGAEHVPIAALRLLHPEDEILTIVREPLERAVSMHWRATSPRFWNTRDFRRKVADGCEWGGWIYPRDADGNLISRVLAWACPQVEFATGADWVGRFDQLDTEFERLLRILGRTAPALKIVNARPTRPPVADVMDSRSEAIIRDRYGADFALWEGLQ